MRKFVCILLAMCAVPVFAAGTITVDVNDQGDGTGIVQITAMGGLPPVGIALVVDANDGDDGDAVVDVNAPVDSFFDVFIDFYASNSAALDDNVFSDDNGHPGANPAAAGALLAGPKVSLSMGELDDVNDANSLSLPIDLAVIDLGGAGDVALSVDTLRGGVVDTSGEDVTVTFAGTGTYDITDAPAVCLGEVTNDGKITASDIITIAGWLNTYGTGRTLAIPSTDTAHYVEAADVTGDSKITASDIITIAGWLNTYGTGRTLTITCPHPYGN